MAVLEGFMHPTYTLPLWRDPWASSFISDLWLLSCMPMVGADSFTLSFKINTHVFPEWQMLIKYFENYTCIDMPWDEAHISVFLILWFRSISYVFEWMEAPSSWTGMHPEALWHAFISCGAHSIVATELCSLFPGGLENESHMWLYRCDPSPPMSLCGVSVVPTSRVFSQVYPLNEVNLSGDFILA